MLAIGCLCVLGFLVAVPPVVMKSSKKSPMTTATSNAKQIYLLLIDFDQDFGAFPNDATAAADLDLAPYHGAYSNDYLGQLLAGGYVKSEEIFYAKHGSRSHYRPDNRFSSQAETLQAGECGFAYVKGLSTADEMKTPILMTPMTGRDHQFAPKAYDGKAVVLTVDGAARQLRLDTRHRAKIGGGKTLFDVGKGTVWETRGFDRSQLLFAK